MKWLFVGLSGLVSGIMYPVSVLPKILQSIARLVPVTYSLEGMRAAVLGHATLWGLVAILARLIPFCRRAVAVLVCGLFLGAAAHQDHRYAHPLLAALLQKGGHPVHPESRRERSEGSLSPNPLTHLSCKMKKGLRESSSQSSPNRMTFPIHYFFLLSLPVG